jgi:hypothetical protein
LRFPELTRKKQNLIIKVKIFLAVYHDIMIKTLNIYLCSRFHSVRFSIARRYSVSEVMVLAVFKYIFLISGSLTKGV